VRGLVLGGGGVTGVAWEIGMIAGLRCAGVDLGVADAMVGTSAGSVVGVQLCSGLETEELYERQLEPTTPEVVATMGRRVQLGYGRALLGSRHDLAGFGRRIGALAIAAERRGGIMSAEDRRAVIRYRLPSLDWPERDLRVTVVDAHTGEFRVITASDGVPLLDAVTASCAVPGVYPPVPIGDRLYVDGGVRSAANADVIDGCARIVALTPLARVAGPISTTRSQLDALGVPSVLISPDAESVAAIGPNVLDPSARAATARAGRRQGEAVAAEVAEVWGL
jgi:NTE family protein